MKILLVDDLPDARLLLHKVLRDAGYRDTLSASSAMTRSNNTLTWNMPALVRKRST